MSKTISKAFAGTLGFLGGLTAAGLIRARGRWGLKTIMTDPYLENLAELYSATKRTGIQEIIEMSLRAETGQLLERPLGTPRKFPSFEGLLFNSAHLKRLPLPSTTPISTEVVLGPQAQRPLVVQTPLLVSGMAFSLALTEEVKYALAEGSSLAQTASNTGEGPFLPQERALAQKLIIQYPRLPLTRNREILEQGDALEIQIGQGASAGGAQASFPALTPSGLPAFRSPEDLPRLVDFLRRVGRGVPVGVKFSFTDHLEEELDLCLAAGVDYLALEGCEAATICAPPILEDDFGLPALIGLCRAVEHLRRRNAAEKVSLIVAGGFKNPGQCLKALALGATAVYLGTMPLFAVSHPQTLKSLPWEPPTQLVVAGGKSSAKFDRQRGARSLGHYLKACTLEIKEGVRALGKHSLKEVDSGDLIAWDPLSSEITGLPLAYSKRKDRADDAPFGK